MNRKLSTALTLASGGQRAALAIFAMGLIVVGLVGGIQVLLAAVASLIITFYCVFVVCKIVWWTAGSRYRSTGHSVARADDPSLPVYTILVPLYREAAVLPSLLKAVSELRYPKDRLEVLLLLEGDDQETWSALRSISLPAYFRPLTVPDGGPRTKPKACNYGFMQATGDMVVIFDAEDRPEPRQLLKAVGAFADAGGVGSPLACVQAALEFWNPRSGGPSAFYWAEYVIHFRWVLIGLAHLGLVPPLGGTSNHFRMDVLRRIADLYPAVPATEESGEQVAISGPWDPFNVTEDADLAFRLATIGHTIEMIDSVTLEEAPNRLIVAIKQRTRWLKGYAQTGLVHSRAPIRSCRTIGVARYLCFNMLMLGTPLSLLLNPVMWATTLTYVVSRMTGNLAASSYIETLFPGPIFYAGGLVFLLGNGVLFYQKLLTPLRQEAYGLTRVLLFTPLWWAATSLSAYRALYELLIPSRRSTWALTPHGHDEAFAPASLPAPAEVPVPLVAGQRRVALQTVRPGDTTLRPVPSES
jgi:glycosyltransferase XagB